MSKQRILLAINDKDAEDALAKYLSEQFDFIPSPVLYKEQTIPMIEKEKPDILIIREKLKGSLSFDGLIHDIRSQYNNTVRIIIITGKREIGDTFFKEMVHYGVYDICFGSPINLAEIIKMIIEPKGLDYGLYLSGEGKSEERTYAPSDDNSIVRETPQEESKGGLFGKSRQQKKASKSTPVQEKPSVPVAMGKQNAVPVVAPQPQISSPATETIPANFSGTQVLEESEDIHFGFLFMPYEMQPVTITNFATAEKIVVGSSGEILGTNLPIQQGVKPLVNQNFEKYARSLVMQTKNVNITPAKLAKTTVFTSVRQGSGCSTIALNTAFTLALKGHKVLYMDACAGRSSTYSRLEMPFTLDGINDALSYLKNGENILNAPLSHEKLLAYSTEENKSRFASFPDTLSFIKYSDSFNSVNDTVATLIPELIRVWGQIYDYVVVDTSLMFFDTYTYKFLEVADTIIMVTLQDLYELNLALDSLKNYEKIDIFGKLSVVVNRYTKLAPSTKDIQEHFHAKNIFTVYPDEKGFIRSYSSGMPYCMSRGKRAVILSYEDIASIL